MNIHVPIFTLSFLLMTGFVTLNALPASPVQKIGKQFTAATIENVSAFYRAQPNIDGWVGPEQYIQITNNNIRSFDKFTGKPDGILDIDSSTIVGTPIADSRLLYDRWGKRWFMLGDVNDFSNTATPGIAVSWTDGPVITPNTRWHTHVFTDVQLVPSKRGSVDSPKIGTDQHAVYINADMFNLLVTEYRGVSVVVIPQSSFAPGNSFDYTIFPTLFNPEEYPAVGGLSQAPFPNNFDPDPKFGYIVVSPAVEVAGMFTYTNYLMLRILNSGSSSPSLFPSSANPISLEAPIFTDGTLIPHKGNLYGANGLLQNTGTNSIDTGGCHVRNHQLYFVTTGLVDHRGRGTLSGDRNAILWYQYDLTGDSSGQGKGHETKDTIPALIQSGAIFDPTITTTPLNYFSPAIMTDKHNNIVIIGNVAGADSYIQAFYTGRKATDPLGTLRENVLLTHNNESYNFGSLFYNDPNGQRWGDYCSISPDPDNDLDLWATSQFIAFRDGWGLLTTEFKSK